MRIARVELGSFALCLSRTEAAEVIAALAGQLSDTQGGGSTPRRIVSGCGIRAYLTVTLAEPSADACEPAVDVVREAIRHLLRNRDFLGYQLARANGSMSDAQFEEVAEEYLRQEDLPDATLNHRVAVLRDLMPGADSEELSVMLGCDLGKTRELRANSGNEANR